MANVKVTLDEEVIEFELDQSGDVILQAVLDKGKDAPFSCRGGICTTCKAKLTSGTVEMDQQFALTDGEIEEGFILTCQSHPTSDSVELTYDNV